MRLVERLLAVLVVIAALLRRTPVGRLPAGVDSEDLESGFERSDLNVGWVVAAGAALLLSLATVLIVVSVLEVKVTGLPVTIERPPDLVDRLASPPTPPPPRLETAEGELLSSYRASAEQQLNSYGWIDRQAGTVHMPIAQAMDRVAQQGLPVATAVSRDSGATSPSRASSGRANERVSR